MMQPWYCVLITSINQDLYGSWYGRVDRGYTIDAALVIAIVIAIVVVAAWQKLGMDNLTFGTNPFASKWLRDGWMDGWMDRLLAIVHDWRFQPGLGE